MDFVRRAASVLRLAGARLRARPALVALPVLGMAAGTGVLAAVLAGGLVAQDRSLANAIDNLPPSSRAVRAVSIRCARQLLEKYGSLDERVRRELATVSERAPTAIALYRESTVAGAYIGLGAVEGLEDWVELESGRLPQPCRPERCEVLLIRGEGRASGPGLSASHVRSRVGRGPSPGVPLPSRRRFSQLMRNSCDRGQVLQTHRRASLSPAYVRMQDLTPVALIPPRPSERETPWP